MKTSVKVILYPDQHKSKNGVFFENIIKDTLERSSYKVLQNLRQVANEIDLIAENKLVKEKILIECKARTITKSEDIKKFVYGVDYGLDYPSFKDSVDKGIFIHTEDLTRDALAIKLKLEEMNPKVSFWGPEIIIQQLIEANKIKQFQEGGLKIEGSISHKVLAITYFGLYYIIVNSNDIRDIGAYVFDATTLEEVTNINQAIELPGLSDHTYANELRRNIRALKHLDFYCLSNSNEKHKTIEREIFNCDSPPAIEKWVGRKKELENISSNNFTTVFITGIGGQGKSALASYYVNCLAEEDNDWEYWDWRDLKEEGNRLHTKVISIIERLTDGDIKASQIKEENIDSLIELLFKHLQNRRILFVFDNIDNYIDLEEFKPTLGIEKIYKSSIQKKHNSKFIFTCRPLLMLADVDLYQVNLEGLNESDTYDLLCQYDISIEKTRLNELSKEIHTLTNGHPLWIHLFAGQAVRGENVVRQFIKDVKGKTNFKEDNLAAILANNVLNTVWLSLNEKQRTLLRGMSETVRSETKENLAKILDSELKYNQFDRSLKTLLRLNLIVTKSMQGEPDELELHPLVKEFIVQKYPQNERTKFITLFVNYYDNVIVILRQRLSWQLPLKEFENWTSKVELEINNKNFKDALITLQEVSDPILTAGYLEEFVRVAELLYSKINWGSAINEEFSYFHEQVTFLIKTLIELGKKIEADELLSRYSISIQGKGIHYVNYCHLKCYFCWYYGDFDAAILWGEKGEKLANANNISLRSVSHDLALARRDSQNKENLEKALKYFLQGEDLSVISDSHTINQELSGTFYGNVGRCLWYKNQIEKAKNCYKKSLLLLNKEKITSTDLNKGYAFYWIGEALEKLGYHKCSLYFFRNAFYYWSKVSPPRANELQKKILLIIEQDEALSTDLNIDDWEVEKYCNDWLSRE